MKKLLVSQPKPATDKSPYYDIAAKYGFEVEFRPFIKVERLPAKEFRAQKINILDHTAIIFTSRHGIDHFFHLCEDMRIAIPDTMKYFCVAEKIALYYGAGAIVTGENLGQVASQTMEAMAVTRAVTTLPIVQPLIGFDKEEIVRLARKIGTFGTSILPYEDCCTVFTPRHPRTKPKLKDVEAVEAALDVEALVEEAFNGIEQIPVGE